MDDVGEKEGLRDLSVLHDVAGKLRLESLLSGEADGNDTYLEVHAGAGGTESQDWAEMLVRMYVRWAERKGCQTEWVQETSGEEAGIKSATLRITGANAYGWLKTESGVHRLVRISPFDSASRRHTSFASAWVYPVVDENIEVDIQGQGPARRYVPRVGGRRPAREPHRQRRAHHPRAHRHRRAVSKRPLATQEPRLGHVDAESAPLPARAGGAGRGAPRPARGQNPTSAGATRFAATCCTPTRWSRICAPGSKPATPPRCWTGISTLSSMRRWPPSSATTTRRRGREPAGSRKSESPPEGALSNGGRGSTRVSWSTVAPTGTHPCPSGAVPERSPKGSRHRH